MKRFIQGEHRGQGTLLPESFDDYVNDTNPVRIADVFVDELDLVNLGFDGAIPADTGRPAYHPEVLLKICVYGYLNRIQSSRRLEREAQRNVEKLCTSLENTGAHSTPLFAPPRECLDIANAVTLKAPWLQRPNEQ